MCLRLRRLKARHTKIQSSSLPVILLEMGIKVPDGLLPVIQADLSTQDRGAIPSFEYLVDLYFQVQGSASDFAGFTVMLPPEPQLPPLSVQEYETLGRKPLAQKIVTIEAANANKVTITYFNLDGVSRGVALRLACQVGKVPYVDERLSFPDFGAEKAKGFGVSDKLSPAGHLPTLTAASGAKIYGSNAILAYISKIGGIWPTNLLEAAQAEAFCDAIEEAAGHVIPTLLMPADQQLTARAALIAPEGNLTRDLSGINKILKVTGWAAGSKFSGADLKLYPISAGLKSGALAGFPGNLLESYPYILAHESMVKAHLDKLGISSA